MWFCFQRARHSRNPASRSGALSPGYSAESIVRGHGRQDGRQPPSGPTRSIQEDDDFATRHRGINKGDDRRNGKAFHDRGVEGVGRFLWLACREIGDAKVRRLYGGHNADDGSRDNESAGKGEPIDAESITALGPIGDLLDVESILK